MSKIEVLVVGGIAARSFLELVFALYSRRAQEENRSRPNPR